MLDCFTAVVLVVAVGVVLVVIYRTQRRTETQARAKDEQSLQMEAMRTRLQRLEARVRELEKVAGLTPEPVPAEPARVTAPPPVPVAVQVEAPAEPVPPPAPPPAPPPVSQEVPPAIPVAPPVQPPVRPQPAVPSLALPPTVRPAASLEERLGARLPVWIGAIALALAGAFLVKYSFDKGWLSPGVRVAMGVLFGVGLLGAGERMRRSAPGIAQGLAAAGIADLFACFLAAVNLYHLIPPVVGFAFMALTAALAVLLSLRHGAMVALIGLIGGFITPALIRTGEPNTRNLFGYLFLLVAGVLAVSWRRRWGPVAGLALGGGLLWVLVWLGGPFQPGDELWLGLFLLASAAAAVVSDLAKAPQEEGEAEGAVEAGPWISRGMLAGAFLAFGLMAERSDFSLTEWVFLGILVTSTLVLARLRPAFEPLAWVAAVAPAVLLAAWGMESESLETGRFLGVALAFGLLIAGGAYAAHHGAWRPTRWAAMSAASGLVFFLLAWGVTWEKRELPWGGLALAAAFLYLAAAVPVARRRAARPELTGALAALAVAATAFVSLAVPLELERQWWTVSWALEVTALVWLAGRLRLPALRALAQLLGLGVAGRLLLNPLIFTYPIGEHLLLNWLVYGYGLSLLAFAAAALLARRQEDENLAWLLEWGALLFGFALLTLEVRQYFHPGNPEAFELDLGEWSTIAVAWLLLGWGLLAENRERRRKSLDQAGHLFLLLGVGCEMIGPVLAVNPLWNGDPVGDVPVFNLLLWIYGVPAVLVALGAREMSRRESGGLAGLLSATALLLAFVLVSLEVRQAFHGPVLATGGTGVAEQYSYSAAWMLYATVLLVLGVMRRVKALRYAALAVMMITVGKVFLYDTGNLEGLYRVFSFLGLGVSLLLLAWIYQRFVFREPGR